MNEKGRDVALRTFTRDVFALAKSQRPQAEIVSMGATHAIPVQQESTDPFPPGQNDRKKQMRLALLTTSIIILLALAGYFVYLLLL